MKIEYYTWYNLIVWADFVLYFYFLLSAFYLFVFAAFSCQKRRSYYKKSRKQYRFAVFFTAYKADDIIQESVVSFLNQTYPKDKYDVIVISDKMKDSTNLALKELPIILLESKIKNSIVARELEYAVKNLDPKAYDLVVIFEANNTSDPNFLEEVNKAYYSGGMAIQTHRIAKNIRTNTSVLDAISEEINNSIFRKGHIRLGFSGGLTDSGMAFNYDWFRKNITKVTDKYISKQLEVILLKQGIYIDYLDNVYTYVEKVQKATSFYKQRKEWLISQSRSFWRNIIDFPKAIFAGNFDYADKILQMLMLPRVLLLTTSVVIAILFSVFKWTMSVKWWVLLILLTLTFYLAIPEKFMNTRTIRALISLPFLALLMFFGLLGVYSGKRKNTNNGYEL